MVSNPTDNPRGASSLEADLTAATAEADATRLKALITEATTAARREGRREAQFDRNWSLFAVGLVSGVVMTLILLAVELAVRR